MGKITRLIKGQAISTEERLGDLERATDKRVGNLEESFGTFKEVLLKLSEERDHLKEENDKLRKILEEGNVEKITATLSNSVIKPIKDEFEEVAELIWEPEKNNGTQIISTSNKSFLPGDKVKVEEPIPLYGDSQKKVTEWLRGKFGLPPSQEKPKSKQTKIKVKKSKKK